MKLYPLAFTLLALSAPLPMPAFAQESGQAPAPVAITAGSLRELLLQGNERVAAREKERGAAELRKGSLVRSFLPALSAEAGRETFRQGNRPRATDSFYGISLQANLFHGGRDFLDSNLREVRAKKREAEKKVAAYEEILHAREVYWKILYHRDLLALYEERIRRNEESLKAAERRIRAGVATQSDRFEFEMSGVTLRQEVILARAELSILKKELASFLGEERPDSFSYPEPLAHDHEWEALLRHSEQEHGFLAEPGRLQAEESMLSAQIMSRFWWPSLDLYAGLRQPTEREDNEVFRSSSRREAVVGLKLRMEFFDGLRSQNEAAALRQEAEGALLDSAYAHRKVDLEVHRETTELRSLHGLVHEAEENIERARKFHVLAEGEYARGVRSSTEMLSATETLFQVRKKRLEILRDFQIAKAHVLSILGR